MIASSIIICLVILGETCSHRPGPAFINHKFSLKTRPFDNNKVFSSDSDNDEALFDAEEAAAFDAHDTSDPGIEGAAMERAVILAEELKGQQMKTKKEHAPKSSFIGKIRSLFRHDESNEEESDDDVFEVTEAEAKYAHDLSDTAAMEHADEILMDSGDEEEDEEDLLDATEAEAKYAHDLSDTAAMEHADEILMDSGDEEEDEEDLLDATEAEAKYAHDLSDTAAMEHADEMLMDSENEEEDEEDLLDATEAEAKYAHDLSDLAAMEHADEKLMDSGNEEEDEEEDEEDLFKANDAEAKYAHDLSDTAAMEHADEVVMTEEYHEETASVLSEKGEEARIASVEEHYKSIEKDIQTIEQLIEEADKADRSEGHSQEGTFSDDGAADLALMMIEKSILAATDKLELCQEKAEQAENEAKAALEAKYNAKALAESIERERRAAEMRFLSTEHFSDDAEVMERRRDFSILHADNELLSDALKREHEAELRLESAIEQDIAAKKEMERMIDNKATLKQEFHDLEKIVHERTLSLWKRENAKKSKSEESKKEHHFDWWHRRW